MVKLFSRRVKTDLKEMRSLVFRNLRDNLDIIKAGFHTAPTLSVLRNTRVSYDKARSLYYNTNPSLSNGAIFAKPIIDGVADHMGLPNVTMADENQDQLVTHWVNDVWARSIWEMYRNALRDTKCWVRLRQPFPSPLIPDDELNDVILEIIDAETVTPYYDPVTGLLERVEIASTEYIEDQPFRVEDIGATGARVYGREHSIIEIITPEQYLFYDGTSRRLLDQYTTTNQWGFVPLIEVFNDFDSSLQGGTSELENPFPFLEAFHELMIQTRTSHGYHADPKVKFKLDDVMSFLANNFPDSVGDDGKFTGQISWKNRDIYFMESEEDVGFIEAPLSTNDSVILLEFLIDCICISAEVTEAVLFRAKSENIGETDELFRFKAKIGRKRNNFSDYIKQIINMAMVISTGKIVTGPKLSWPSIQMADQVAQTTAANNAISSAEVANRAGAISLETYRAHIRQYFPQMRDSSTESIQVQKEQQQEQQRQIDLEKAMAKVHASAQPKPPGVNSATRQRNGRVPLPIDVVPKQPGE